MANGTKSQALRTLPIDDASPPGELATLLGILVELDLRPVGVVCPDLPACICPHCFLRDFETLRKELRPHGIDVIDFEAEVGDPAGRSFWR